MTNGRGEWICVLQIFLFICPIYPYVFEGILSLKSFPIKTHKKVLESCELSLNLQAGGAAKHTGYL